MDVVLQFVMAYDELYRVGGQHIFLSDSVEGMRGHLPADNSTVVFGMLHANFNTFDTVAMRQRLFYNADSVLRENTSVNVSLFDENNTYMVAPLMEQSPSTAIRFVIDGHFLFDNTTNPLTSLRIDFGDGYGESQSKKFVPLPPF